MKAIVPGDTPDCKYDPARDVWQMKRGWCIGFIDPFFILFVAAAFEWNLASVPRPARPIIGNHECGVESTLIHDLLYRYRGVLPDSCVTPYRTFTRAEADRIFLAIMQSYGVPGWRAWLAYTGVRVGGWLPWLNGTPAKETS